MGKLIMILLLTTTAASAGEMTWGRDKLDNMPVPVPTEQQKAEALREAYRARSGANDARPVKTERIIPVANSADKNELDEAADSRSTKADVCERHHMHKITHGKSWRCKR